MEHDAEDSFAAAGTLFAEPDGYYPPTPPPFTAPYVLDPSTLPGGASDPADRTLTLHLVGASVTEAHRLWNGGVALARHFERHADLVRGKRVLELGCGAAAPGLVAALLGARDVVVTDFPDADIEAAVNRGIDGLEALVERSQLALRPSIRWEGFVWGGDVAPLLREGRPGPGSRRAAVEDTDVVDGGNAHQTSPVAATATETTATSRFDVVVLADLLFRHSEHSRLVKTVTETLARPNSNSNGDGIGTGSSEGGRAYVVFTSYRPWLRDRDLAFFDVARSQGGLVVEPLFEFRTERPLFEDDPGDEDVRRTVSGFVLHWPAEGEQAAGANEGGRGGDVDT